jgi:DNA-binding response OmpR family regulator
MSGEQLFRVISEEHPELARKVIFSSGDMMREETIGFLRSAGCAALQKPYELAELVSTIRALNEGAAMPGDTVECNRR